MIAHFDDFCGYMWSLDMCKELEGQLRRAQWLVVLVVSF